MGFADKFKAAVGGDIHQKIQEHLPAIQQLFRDKIGVALREHLSDPEKLISASKSVYSILPMPVRLLVKEEVFVQFCQEHKAELVG